MDFYFENFFVIEKITIIKSGETEEQQRKRERETKKRPSQEQKHKTRIAHTLRIWNDRQIGIEMN